MGAPRDGANRWRRLYVDVRRTAPSVVSLTVLQPSGLFEQHTLVLQDRPDEPGLWMQQADVPLEGGTLGLQQDSRGLLRLEFAPEPSVSPQDWILYPKLPNSPPARPPDASPRPRAEAQPVASPPQAPSEALPPASPTQDPLRTPPPPEPL